MLKINNVAVLGTGVMGSQIAAHCANAGLKVFAFDMSWCFYYLLFSFQIPDAFQNLSSLNL